MGAVNICNYGFLPCFFFPPSVCVANPVGTSLPGLPCRCERSAASRHTTNTLFLFSPPKSPIGPRRAQTSFVWRVRSPTSDLRFVYLSPSLIYLPYSAGFANTTLLKLVLVPFRASVHCVVTKNSLRVMILGFSLGFQRLYTGSFVLLQVSDIKVVQHIFITLTY